MNLVNLQSHTIDLDLLPEVPKVLDVGCRWFDFAGEILRHRRQASVVAFDPDPEITDPNMPGVKFIRAAVVGGSEAFSKYASYSSGEGNFLFNDANREPHGVVMIPFCNWRIHYPKEFTVACVRIADLGVEHWDVIKLDCEGSEFEILENFPGPIATQISVEFHDFTGPRAETRDEYYPRLWDKLPWYRVVQHELTKKGEGVGHWDTLLVLR